jgi:LmbE family N-acetylglucosaminyl deacetylase
MPLPDSHTKVLVISPHQDDETLIAGDYMIKTMQSGGEVFVIYTTNGVSGSSFLKNNAIADIIKIREREVITALGIIKIKRKNIIFLRNEDKKALMGTVSLNNTIDLLARYIIRINPDLIFVPAYEGGHCDHDMTNFATMSAIKRHNIKGINTYEGPEYNFYMSPMDYILGIISKFSLIIKINRPRFVNNTDERILSLNNITSDDLITKRSMLNAFVSQDLVSLIEAHSKKDIYRLIPKYTYLEPPYARKKMLGYHICLLLGRSNCDSFNVCKVSFDEMSAVMRSVHK